MKPIVIKVLQKTGRFADPRPFAYSPGYVFVHDSACRDYDWLVVYDEFEHPETLACPQERTILCTWEPTSIKSYSRAYTRQFGHLLTNRPPAAERHPHYHLGRGYFYWFNDRTPAECASAVIARKTKTISAVCSSKQMRHTKHYARFRLVGALEKAIPGFDWYGHGVRGFGKKFEVLDPYRYHVAVENHIGPHHWTEKLADALLSECLPFYAGDPAIAEALPADCVIPIPIDDPEAAVRIVREAIADDEYSKRRPAILEAKRLILEKYNFWAQVVSVIESVGEWPAAGSRLVRPVVVLPRKVLRRRCLAAMLEEGWAHLRRGLGA